MLWQAAKNNIYKRQLAVANVGIYCYIHPVFNRKKSMHFHKKGRKIKKSSTSKNVKINAISKTSIFIVCLYFRAGFNLSFDSLPCWTIACLTQRPQEVLTLLHYVKHSSPPQNITSTNRWTQQYVYATYVLTNKLDSESCFLNVNWCPLALYTPELTETNIRAIMWLKSPGRLFFVTTRLLRQDGNFRTPRSEVAQ